MEELEPASTDARGTSAEPADPAAPETAEPVPSAAVEPPEAIQPPPGAEAIPADPVESPPSGAGDQAATTAMTAPSEESRRG